MVDQFSDEIGRKAGAHVEAIPMLFVHMISGLEGRILGAQGLGVVGIAFEVQAQGVSIFRDDRKHFTEDLEDQRAFTERIGGGGGLLG